ncbi:MAG TPA: hypothetical protein VD757_01700 [Candidatus Nitrosocosmicus sp.]|nr:hypothetical protein [Candidatus Nitrosocosmicus sp.]
MDKLNIANIARGALIERADVEVQNVLNNIYDKNTDWRKKRKVTLTLEFKALDESRDTVVVDLQAKSSVAPYNTVTTQIFLEKDKDGQVIAEEFLKGTIPGQVDLVDTETGEILDRSKVVTMKK